MRKFFVRLTKVVLLATIAVNSGFAAPLNFHDSNVQAFNFSSSGLSPEVSQMPNLGVPDATRGQPERSKGNRRLKALASVAGAPAATFPSIASLPALEDVNSSPAVQGHPTLNLGESGAARRFDLAQTNNCTDSNNFWHGYVVGIAVAVAIPFCLYCCLQCCPIRGRAMTARGFGS